jgi:hypothetical protein
MSLESSVGQSENLRDDVALKAFLSKEVENQSPLFVDYAPTSAPTSALIDAAIDDVMRTLGICED